MKLLMNAGDIPNEILANLLKLAGRLAGARTGRVMVQVNPARWFHCKGMAYGCRWVRTKGNRISAKGRQYNLDGGYFTITLPRVGMWGAKMMDALTQAKTFFRVAIHEWAHIRDRQIDKEPMKFFGVPVDPIAPKLSWASRGKSGRRMKHDDRPEEVRANGTVYDVIHNEDGYVKASKELMGLAIWMEGTA